MTFEPLVYKIWQALLLFIFLFSCDIKIAVQAKVVRGYLLTGENWKFLSRFCFLSNHLLLILGEMRGECCLNPFLLFMVSFSIMIISARAGASGTQLSKIHASHSLGASRWQILRYVIFPNSLPEILTGVRVAIGMCWGTLVAAEFLAGTTGIGFVENVAKKYFQYEVIWITIFVMGMLGLLFDVTLRKLIDKYIPWRGKG